MQRAFVFRSYDWVLVASALLLIIVGVVAVYSVDIAETGESVFGKKQLVALAVGVVLFIAASLLSYTLYRATATWWYVGGLLLLVSVLFFGATIRGTRGWFQFAGFSFQPVEFMKVALVLMFAKFASRQRKDFKRVTFLLGSATVVVLPMALIFFQPDLGSAMLLGMFWLGMVIMLRVRWRYIVGLGVIAVAGVILAWIFVLQPYQKERVITFVRPEHDPLGAGYNITQSVIAIGSGKWLGRGLGFGSQSQLRFLPESRTDFIFAMIAEAFGFIGSLVLVGIFGLLWYRLSRMMLHVHDEFAVLVLLGTLVMISVQWFVNIGATLGLLPVTGIPMPLVSYGGSSLISTLLLLGIAESMYAGRKEG